jgi:hypothetical protein
MDDRIAPALARDRICDQAQVRDELVLAARKLARIAYSHGPGARGCRFTNPPDWPLQGSAPLAHAS